ncbi:MAG: hypothetical protein SF187_19990 [Deltaproteobacteria bacterium]|nr:hypothetical protein [Deltaproteobacteria bacterium]
MNTLRLAGFCLLLFATACNQDDKLAVADGGATDGGGTTTPLAKAAKGGARLKAMLAQSAEGISVSLGWYDSKLNTLCKFVETDNGIRCMPLGGASALFTEAPAGASVPQWFTDATCQEQALPSTPATQEGALGIIFDLHCSRTTGYFRVGPAIPLGSGFVKPGETCVAASQEMLPQLRKVLPANLEDFVKATPMVDPAQTGIADVILRGEDGSQQPYGLRDTTGGFDCSPAETREGLRCIPTMRAERATNLFADPACGQEVARVGAIEGPECLQNLGDFRYIESRGFEGVIAMHEIGQPLVQTYEKQGDTCVASDVAAGAFSFGTELPLARFASVEVVDETKGRLTQKVWKAGSARIEDDRVTSASSGAPCMLATTSDDVVRCVPYGWSGVDLQFADAACTNPVWLTYGPQLSIATPERMAVKGAPGGFLLPRVLRVLDGGELYSGPVFAKRLNSCDFVPNVPNSRQPYKIGMKDVSPKTFPAMPFMLR